MKRVGMTSNKSRQEGIHALYQRDPIQADKLVFGRQSGPDRRGFIKGLGLSTMAAVLGVSSIPFHRNYPGGLIPAALANTDELFSIKGKDGLIVLNDRPLNAETPAHLLDDRITPIERHFVRNNGHPPANMAASSWRLHIDGLVDQALSLSIGDLKTQFEVVTWQLVLECAGNGRQFFKPAAKGNQWGLGAVGCAQWTGVRLADVLNRAGVDKKAIYTAHYGADHHLSWKDGKLPISRGIPIEKALDGTCLLAFEMNGEAIHPMNGAPLRLLVPGWPASCSHKWLTRIELRDQVHDGAKMTGKSYRVPNRPVAPGEKVATEDFDIIERMPVKSLITYPRSGTQLSNRTVQMRGHAWSGERTISAVEISTDFGASWTQAKLSEPTNHGAWQQFEAKQTFAQAGYYEIWARATDDQGDSQPFAIRWNPKGYLNNSLHRVALKVV